MADFTLTMEDLMKQLNAHYSPKMDDTGAISITFPTEADAKSFLDDHMEFHFVGGQHYVAANIEADFTIIAAREGVGNKHVKFFVHGLHDWIPLMNKLARWRELPDADTLGEVSKMMTKYQANSELVRKGLYTLIGSSARRIGNPEAEELLA